MLIVTGFRCTGFGLMGFDLLHKVYLNFRRADEYFLTARTALQLGLV